MSPLILHVLTLAGFTCAASSFCMSSVCLLSKDLVMVDGFMFCYRFFLYWRSK